MKFGVIIRARRKEQGITQRDFAKQIGVNFTYISKIENGALEPPSEAVIQKMAQVLELDANELCLAAGKLPSKYKQLVLQDKTVNLFMRKYSSLTEEQKNRINIILTENIL